MRDILEVKEVSKDYGNGKGVFDISFSVREGEVFGYLGPNGAGKTTTIRQLMGFIHPDKGRCEIFQKDCFMQAAEIQKELGYLPGELTFFEDMSGKKYLEFMAKMKGMKDSGRMEELIERFELNPQGRIKKMSKGMKQKIGIIAAFMNHPKVAILDEPTSGLDPLMQNRFVELILEEKKKGCTILMSSHIFEEIEKTCDRTAIIRQGRIADIEDMKNLSKKRKKIYTVTLKNPQYAEKLGKEPGIEVKEIRENKVAFYYQNELSEVLHRIADYEPVDLEIQTQSLEELFMQYYGEGEKE